VAANDAAVVVIGVPSAARLLEVLPVVVVVVVVAANDSAVFGIAVPSAARLLEEDTADNYPMPFVRMLVRLLEVSFPDEKGRATYFLTRPGRRLLLLGSMFFLIKDKDNLPTGAQNQY